MEKQLDIAKPNNREETVSDAVKSEDSQRYDKVYFEWDGMEYEFQDKSLRWFAIAGLISLAALAYVIYTQDWFMVAVVIIMDGLLYFYSKRKPMERHYQITRIGIYVDDTLYPFETMHSFWVVFNQNVKTLNFVFLKKYLPVFTVPVTSVDPLKLKAFSKKFLPEQERREELFADKLLRYLKI
jgi:hypothetical protein